MSCGDSGSCGDQPAVSGECRCDGGQPKNFLRPCLLLLLAEQSAHGYELLDRLRPFGFSRDPGGLYRVLRALEREGQVQSRWVASAVGPDRCLYDVTPAGRDWLIAWARTLEESRRVLDAFLGRFDGLTAGPAVAVVPESLRSIISAERAVGDDMAGGGLRPGHEESK